MINVELKKSSYKTFQDVLTGYRLTQVLLTAHEEGVFEIIGPDGASEDRIISATGWSRDYGTRFLAVMVELGLLEKSSEQYRLSRFSDSFLLKTSDDYQGPALTFEKRLFESWGMLGETLLSGKRVYGAASKDQADYDTALDSYLGAMNCAARIRANEVWDTITPDDHGVILDVGAGSGAFLTEFLKRHPGWTGVFCDLEDVVERAKKRKEIHMYQDRIRFVACNLLEAGTIKHAIQSISSDIVLFSNIVHCQGESETRLVFDSILPCLTENGVVLVHDFFKDCGWRGALYDLHMMVNTFNGRTYQSDAIVAMLKKNGITNHKTFHLPSASTLIIASKKSFDEF